VGPWVETGRFNLFILQGGVNLINVASGLLSAWYGGSYAMPFPAATNAVSGEFEQLCSQTQAEYITLC